MLMHLAARYGHVSVIRSVMPTLIPSPCNYSLCVPTNVGCCGMNPNRCQSKRRSLALPSATLLFTQRYNMDKSRWLSSCCRLAPTPWFGSRINSTAEILPGTWPSGIRIPHWRLCLSLIYLISWQKRQRRRNCNHGHEHAVPRRFYHQ